MIEFHTMFDLKSPCVTCPFRKGQGSLFGLPLERLFGIFYAVAFQCHKTVDYDEVDDEDECGRNGTGREHKSQQCAGLMAVLHRENQPNQIMQVAERFGHLDCSTLDPRQEAYASKDDAIRAHHEGKEPTRE